MLSVVVTGGAIQCGDCDGAIQCGDCDGVIQCGDCGGANQCGGCTNGSFGCDAVGLLGCCRYL